MPRVFLPDTLIAEKIITVRDEKAAYISSVMRCGAGDLIEIRDGSGWSFSARILSSSKKMVEAEIVGKVRYDTESFLKIRLFQGLLKGDRMDLVIQKTVELGVNEIIPVITERSQVRETRKTARWRKIAEEASRQSGRSVIPVVHEAESIDRFFDAESGAGRKGIVFWEMGGARPGDIFDSYKGAVEVDLFTGPEGGLSAHEVDSLVCRGFTAATLGRRILRAETAAISAVSLVQFALGDLGIARS